MGGLVLASSDRSHIMSQNKSNKILTFVCSFFFLFDFFSLYLSQGSY